MGREISCEIALKKGTKRERSSGGDKREQTKRLMDTPSADSAVRKKVATGSTQRSGGVVKESLARVHDKVPTDADVDARADTVSEEESKREATAIEGKPSKGNETKQSKASAVGMESLSKQEARKIARKAAKKELKQKAKDRAREKKAMQTTNREATSVGTDRGDIEKDESETLDPKAAKLNERARTLLVFGVADDLTAKQLLKRVKKARRSHYYIISC